MLTVVDVFKVGDDLSVTLTGNCTAIKNGSLLADQMGNTYQVLSVGMVHYTEPSQISNGSNNAVVLLSPNTLGVGEKLVLA